MDRGAQRGIGVSTLPENKVVDNYITKHISVRSVHIAMDVAERGQLEEGTGTKSFGAGDHALGRSKINPTAAGDGGMGTCVRCIPPDFASCGVDGVHFLSPDHRCISGSSRHLLVGC